MLRLRRPWDSQPQEAVELDAHDSLLDGIAFVIVHGPGGRRELVRGLSASAGTSTSGVNTAGYGDKYSSTGQWNSNALVTSTGDGAGDFTLLSYSAPVAEDDATALISSCSGTGLQQAYLLANTNSGFGVTSGALSFGGGDGNLAVLTQASGVIDGNPHVFVGLRRAAIGYVDIDGAQVATAAMSSSSVWGAGAVVQTQGINGYSAWTSGTPPVQLIEMGWNRALTADERARVGINPWRIFAPRSSWYPTSVAGGGPSPVVGTLTQTLAGATVAATGSLALAGVLSQTLAAATLASTAALGIKATTSATLADATLSATGSLAVTGSGVVAQTLADATVSATGALALAGVVSQTLAGATLTGAAVLPITGTVSQTLDAATLSAQGTSQAVSIGTLSATLDAATVAAVAKLAIAAYSAPTLADATLSATATMPMAGISASVGVTLGNATLASSATVLIKGSATITLGACTIVATGAEDAVVPVVLGSLVGSTRKFGMGRPAAISKIRR